MIKQLQHGDRCHVTISRQNSSTNSDGKGGEIFTGLVLGLTTTHVLVAHNRTRLDIGEWIARNSKYTYISAA